MVERVVTWVGEVDIARVLELTEQFEAVLAVGDVDRMAFDLSTVTFLDFSGVGVLLDARNQARQLGVDIALRNPSRSVRRTLSLGGLTDVFTVTAA